jgi:hypothetical protein
LLTAASAALPVFGVGHVDPARPDVSLGGSVAHDSRGPAIEVSERDREARRSTPPWVVIFPVSVGGGGWMARTGGPATPDFLSGHGWPAGAVG